MPDDPIDYAEQVMRDAEDEVAYFEEKDREIEEEQERKAEEDARRFDEGFAEWQRAAEEDSDA